MKWTLIAKGELKQAHRKAKQYWLDRVYTGIATPTKSAHREAVPLVSTKPPCHLPKHLPHDLAVETCRATLTHHVDMAQITGGKGFRQPRTGKHKKQRYPTLTRLDTLFAFAELGPKTGFGKALLKA